MGESSRILCVSADREALRYLECLYPGREHEVLTAQTGAEGISLLSDTGPTEVILAEYGTPGPDTAEFFREVRRRWPDAVRIGISRDMDPAAAESVVRDGDAFKILSWPPDGEAVRAAIENALERFHVVRTLRGGNDAVLRETAQEVELRDSYTRGHCDRVATYALKVASALGLPEGAKQPLRHGSWLHDCGKIGVPEAILNHPGKLSPAQFAVVRNHPAWGAQIANLAMLPPEVADILLHHHERFDGRGYPAGARGRDIPLGARIVAVADVFDAVTTDRPYARGYGREEAIQVVGVLRGGALDPELVDALFAALAEGGDIPP